jgi:hypothetical protein
MKKIILKSKRLLEISGLNTNQLAMKARVPQQTAYKYIGKPEKVQALDATTLAKFFLDGLGLSPEQVLEMKIGDLFEFVDKNEAAP